MKRAQQLIVTLIIINLLKIVDGPEHGIVIVKEDTLKHIIVEIGFGVTKAVMPSIVIAVLYVVY